jgi:multidrug efflux pump subunit AcrA (membrane-fusion protein)
MRKTKRSKTKTRNRKHNYLGNARIKYYSIKKGGNRSLSYWNSSSPRTITPNRNRTISRSFTKDNSQQQKRKQEKRTRQAEEKARAAEEKAREAADKAREAADKARAAAEKAAREAAEKAAREAEWDAERQNPWGALFAVANRVRDDNPEALEGLLKPRYR